MKTPALGRGGALTRGVVEDRQSVARLRGMRHLEVVVWALTRSSYCFERSLTAD